MHSCRIELPEYIVRLLAQLDTQGYTGYLVGGCVRDALLGNCPQDYDIAVAASPEELLRVFSEYRTVETGIRYGTVTVMVEGHPVEVTSFRRDGKYIDGRHPAAVEYTDSLTEDLARRDFTVNAMAYRPDTGLTDPFGGQNDLRRGVLACVGDPCIRFTEDGLRILRAMRFCSVLGFTADPALVSAADVCSPLLREISAERIFSELVKCLCGGHVRQVLRQFVTPLCTVIPELAPAVGFDQKNPHHIYTVYDHIAAAVEACPPKRVLRLTMLLHDIAKPYVVTEDEMGVRHFRGHQEMGAQMAREILTRLTCDKKTTEKVCQLIRYHDLRPAVERTSIHRYLLQVGGYENALAAYRGAQGGFVRPGSRLSQPVSPDRCGEKNDFAATGGGCSYRCRRACSKRGGSARCRDSVWTTNRTRAHHSIGGSSRRKGGKHQRGAAAES